MLRRLLISLAVCTLALAGCTAPDNPVIPGNQGNQQNQENQGGQGTAPVNPEKTVSVTFTLSLKKTESSQEYAFPSTKADNVKLRYTLGIYLENDFHWADASPVVKKSIYLDSSESCSERIELKQAHYTVLVWADYVKDNTTNWFWNPFNLSQVEYATFYQGSLVYKQSYYCRSELDIRTANQDRTESIELEPAGSGFRIIATDASSFEGKDLTAVISYLDPIPLTFDVGNFMPVGGQSGLSFSSPVEKLDDGTVSIADDFILMNVDTSFKATLTLQEKDGTVLLKQDITIPIKKGYNTILKGEVLSAGGGGGGITVDPSFEDNIDISF